MSTRSDRSKRSAARRKANRARGKARKHKRVRARAIIPGTRYLTTRRCLERRMFLHPDPKVRKELHNFIGYCLGIALRNTGVLLHAMCVESNHIHQSLTDIRGHLPKFKESFHGWLARGINKLRGRSGTFWEKTEAVDVRGGDKLLDDEGAEVLREALDDLVYVLTNPVKDGLVRHGDRWPGFTTYGWRFGETRTFTRPTWFFDPNNPKMTDTIEVTLARPPDLLPELSDDQVYERLMAKVHAREAEYQSQLRKKNRRFMGETKLAKQHWDRAPKSYEERFVMKKRVRDPDVRRRVAALRRDRDWRRDYADARERLLAGERAAAFPFGTYQLRHRCGVAVAQAPP